MTEPLVEQLKTCTWCKQLLPITSFGIASIKTQRRYYLCRKCAAQQTRDRRAQKGEHVREVVRKGYAANPTKVLERNKQYYEEHREEVLAYYNQYHLDHPEYHTKGRHKRRATLKGAYQDGSVTIQALNELLSTWTGICPKCAREASPTIDHIISLKAGGPHSMTNLQLLCRSCNSSKGAR